MIKKHIIKIAVVVLAVVTLFLIKACGDGNENKGSTLNIGGEDVSNVINARGLTPEDVLAAVKTFMPTGKYDDYLLFASGGHSGQVLVIGVPSMRLLKVIGV